MIAMIVSLYSISYLFCLSTDSRGQDYSSEPSCISPEDFLGPNL
jgi:hypothetical protein